VVEVEVGVGVVVGVVVVVEVGVEVGVVVVVEVGVGVEVEVGECPMKNAYSSEPFLLSNMGKRVLLLCESYFYDGIVEDLTPTEVRLRDASIVYETGEWTDKVYKDAQKLPRPLVVMLSKVEAATEGRG
jgi:hypothetical protein